MDELNKIILTDLPSKGFKLLEETGLLEIILPEVYNMKGVDVIEDQAHKDNFLHSLQVLDNVSGKSDNIWLRWAALLHDIGKPPTKKYSQYHWKQSVYFLLSDVLNYPWVSLKSMYRNWFYYIYAPLLL